MSGEPRVRRHAGRPTQLRQQTIIKCITLIPHRLERDDAAKVFGPQVHRLREQRDRLTRKMHRATHGNVDQVAGVTQHVGIYVQKFTTSRKIFSVTRPVARL